MKMDNAYEDSEISEINMTPFVDIVLVILVIFMATATFVAEGKIAISLPKATQNEQSLEPTKPIIITIDKEGKFYFEENLVEIQSLNNALIKNYDRASKDGVILRSDAKTSFEYVVKAIDICKQNSISKFSIQTQE
ncbi:Biopolymer transport protein ExbD/TolR [Sulfurimonas denitrificans DSM 1251]|jgi:biopolymer transport protein ExbD|uniref:Biopolymer transport protein ExbD/TolR n=1 Tax=Sulfurimonas denitrificans (strain ATCC 33889 / DSM 1251) TaxID=326298 RepID=Q30QB1_SULDN|nr:biopolymer transporter ExbD [Sulfurimonas denitrificans]ABB44820.1 Biopolymer transport protein ExbD/TolR [Sulfurimonas denitrificans DSM 1251]MDD3443624.1 biopolymer transporter ExbD [Sulfurimonas denitrificans]